MGDFNVRKSPFLCVDFRERKWNSFDPVVHSIGTERTALPENGPLNMGKERESSDSWLAAMAYLPFLCAVPYLFYGDRDFVAYHARQGVLIFFLEIVGVLGLWIFDKSLGRIPFLGLLLVVILRLLFFLPALALIVLGFAKALTGEKGPLPWIGHWAERIPPARSKH